MVPLGTSAMSILVAAAAADGRERGGHKLGARTKQKTG